jgi:hypothetical protein
MAASTGAECDVFGVLGLVGSGSGRPVPEAVLVQWVSADRLIPIRDATPADGH